MYERDLTEEDLGKLAESLIGTQKSVDEGLSDTLMLMEDEVSPESLNRLEELAFECYVCGWWFDIVDLGVNGKTCRECEDEIYQDLDDFSDHDTWPERYYQEEEADE